MRICFFANMKNHANWREMFDTVEFYKVDIDILRSLGHEVVLAGDLKSLDQDADLYYCWWWTYAFYPLFRNMLRRRPVIVTGAFDYDTCRGVIPGLSYLDKPFWQRTLMRFALKHATTNLFISECEYKLVTDHLPVHQPQLCPLAINTAFYHPQPQPQENFFFTVSWSSKTNAIRKCLDSIVMAFGQASKVRPDLRLKIAGKKGDHHDQLVKLASEAGVLDRVDFLGMISDEQKRDLYRQCVAYVQPTLFEGFGHAIGEAIACGAQVITSRSGAVPEVAGTHARFVTPNDVPALAEAMSAAAAAPMTAEAQARQLEFIEAHYSIEKRKAHLASIIESAMQTR